MYTTYHPSRRKFPILYHLLAIGSLFLPQVTCQFMFPTLPPATAIFTTQTQCRTFYNQCMDTFRTCLNVAGPNNTIRMTCEDWRSKICEDMIRMGCDGLPNERQTGGGGTLGGGTLGMGMTSSNRSWGVSASSTTCALKSMSTVSPPSIPFPSLSSSSPFPSPSLPLSTSPQPTQTSDSTLQTPTPTQGFPSPTTPPIIPPTLFSSFTTIVVTSTITTTQTFTTGTLTWTSTMTRTMTTAERRGLNFTMIANDSTRPWCRTGIGVVFLFFWSVVGWAGCLV